MDGSVRKRGGRWWIRIRNLTRLDDGTVVYALGQRLEEPARTDTGALCPDEKTAKARLRQLLKQVAAADLEGEMGPRKPSTLTVGQLRTAFVAAPAPQRAKDGASYLRDAGFLLGHAVEHFGADRLVESIRPEHIDAWVEAMQDEGLKASTVRARVFKLVVAVRWATRPRKQFPEGVSPLPRRLAQHGALTAGVDLPQLPPAGQPVKPEECFDDDEARAIIAAATERPWPPLIQSALWTGARLSELLTLPWSAIDFKANTVRFCNTKTRRDRVVPLPAAAVASLTAWKASKARDRTLVFADAAGRPRKPAEVRTAKRLWWARLQEVCTAAGVDPRGMHACRHTFISALIAADVPDTEVQKLVGHTTLAMLARYHHLRAARARAAIAALPYASPPPKPKRPTRGRKPKLRIVSSR